MKLSSTDLEIGIEAYCPGDIVEEGETTVPAKLFTELVNSLTDDTLTLDGTDKTLNCYNQTNQKCLSDNQFRGIPETL